MVWIDRVARAVETRRGPVVVPSPGEDPHRYRERARRSSDALWAAAGCPDVEAAVDSQDVWTDGPEPVRLVVHRPRSATGQTPGVLTFFGGAFRQGGADQAIPRALDRWRAQAAGVAVVAVDYALAPEHPWPVALHQGLGALEWLADHGDEIGVDAGRLALSGVSAGANLAASVALGNRSRSRNAVPVHLLLLEVPPLDLTWAHLERSVLPDWPAAAVPQDLRDTVETYLAEGVATDPLVSPLLAPDLSGLPPTCILAAESDPLVGDARAFAWRLDEAGVPVSLVVAAGQTHDSNAYVGCSLAARQWQGSVAAALRLLHEEGSW